MNIPSPLKFLATGGLIVWGLWWHLLAHLTLQRFNFSDFGRFYYAMRSWRGGASLYDPSVATWLTLPGGEGMHLWNLNSPHVSLIFWPLSFFSVEKAFAIWSLVTFFCLAGSAQMIVDALEIRLTRSSLALAAAFVFASTPTLSYAATGNVTGPLTLLTTWIWVQWRNQRHTRLAIGIGIAWSSKLFFLPLLVYLAGKRQWKTFGLAVLTGSLTFAGAVAVFGWPEHGRWLAAISDVQWPWLTSNSSIIAPLARIAYIGNGESASAPQITTAVRVGLVFAAMIAAIGLITACFDNDRDRALLLLLLTCLVASPLGWLYYWWTFAGPLVACLKSKIIRRAFWLSLPGWLIPVYLLWPYGTVWFAASVGSLYSWALLLLWCGCTAAAWKSPSFPRYKSGERPSA